MTTEPPVPIDWVAAQRNADKCALLIVAAGFEERSLRVIEKMAPHLPKRLVVVQYPPGIRENDATAVRVEAVLNQLSAAVAVDTVVMDARRPDDYLQLLRATLSKCRPDAVGEAWVDVSALPMQGICTTLAAVRETLPALGVRVLYTEARAYFPTKREVAAVNSLSVSLDNQLRGDGSGSGAVTARRAPHAKGASALAPDRQDLLVMPAMSQEMSGNLIPKHFAGSSGETATCLIVFAGYEKHRSIGVVDELNPSKLVLVFGQPQRQELKWRMAWSEKLHEQLAANRPTAREIVSTLNPLEALSMLNKFYGFMFADHNIAVAPICSKMQGVACYLFWERYRDVQLVFPLPVSYLPRRFSAGVGETYQFALPDAEEMAAVTPSAL